MDDSQHDQAAPAQPAAVTRAPRKATSGTRKGNGAGWGGPARGAGRGSPAAPAFTAGNKAAAGRKAKPAG